MISTPVVAANIFSPAALIIILVVVIVIFGPSRLPKLGQSLGKTMKAIKDSADDDETEEAGAGRKTAKAEASDEES